MQSGVGRAVVAPLQVYEAGKDEDAAGNGKGVPVTLMHDDPVTKQRQRDHEGKAYRNRDRAVQVLQCHEPEELG